MSFENFKEPLDQPLNHVSTEIANLLKSMPNPEKLLVNEFIAVILNVNNLAKF